MSASRAKPAPLPWVIVGTGWACSRIAGALERMPELAGTGADFVSVGGLTHSAAAADISFEIEPLPSTP